MSDPLSPTPLSEQERRLVSDARELAPSNPDYPIPWDRYLLARLVAIIDRLTGGAVTVPVPLTDIEARRMPTTIQGGKTIGGMNRIERDALIRALRIAVEGLDRAAWLADDQRTEAAYEECHERLAAVRELVDLGEEP